MSVITDIIRRHEKDINVLKEDVKAIRAIVNVLMAKQPQPKGVKRASALVDGSRRHQIMSLATELEEICTENVVRAFDMSTSNASTYLKVLCNAGFLKVSRNVKAKKFYEVIKRE